MASRPPEDDGSNDDQARSRWMLIQVLRTFGFAVAILGILMIAGAINLAGDVNQLVGYAFAAVGLVDGFVMPLVLARKWRTPPA